MIEMRARRGNLLFTNFQVLKRMSCQAERSRSLIIQVLLLNAGTRILLVPYLMFRLSIQLLQKASIPFSLTKYINKKPAYAGFVIFYSVFFPVL